jgi:tetratricopeptide (TPR) repeat protein
MIGDQETLNMLADTLKRRPVRNLPMLDELFRRLPSCSDPGQASETEDRIWQVWMHHPNRDARDILERATGDIAARRYDIAETRLASLVRNAPDFAEAWHKRATLYYLVARDEECVGDIRRTLHLEPRHFGAILHFGELLLDNGQRDAARLAFFKALCLNPHLARARSMLASLGLAEGRREPDLDE